MIYDNQGVDYSDGARALSATQFYSRFTQNFIQAISVATAEGPLYEVDMRLRPSGRQGPVAVSLQGFENYQKHEAWTWEHMALLRARVVAGEESLAREVMTLAGEALAMDRDRVKIRQDVVDMRVKLRENFTDIKPLTLKHGAGRMMETELMLQGMGLLQHVDHAGNSSHALFDAVKDALKPEEAAEIERALAIYSGLTQLARLSFAGEMPDDLPEAWLARQSVITHAATQSALEDLLAKNAKNMSDIFDHYFGDGA